MALDDQRGEAAERRQAGVAAARRLLFVEALGIARQQRADHRVPGLVGLQQPAPPFLAAPRPPRHLLQQLERPLRRARIAARQADVGIDDSHQRQMRKVVALGHQLGADDEIRVAARHGLQLRPHPLRAPRQIRGQDKHAPVRKGRRRLLRQPLDARAAGGQRLRRIAFRAVFRPPFDMAAMVAGQRAAEAVLDQPGGAVGALEAMAAAFAQGERRVAAAVEEQQRLLAALHGLRRLPHEARRQPLPLGRAVRAQVDRGEVRHRPRRKARPQHLAPVAALLRVDPRLDRRRRRGQHHRRALDPPAHHRHVAGVVGHAVVLLIGALVLFIHDDQPQIGEGQEQRRARAGNHLHLPRGHALP